MSEAAVANHPESECRPAQSPPAVPAKSEPLRGIDPSELIDSFVEDRVHYLVDKIGEAYRLTHHDREDLSQSLFAALSGAARRYNPAKAQQHTFACRVLLRAAAHEARTIRNARRNPARSPLLLSDLQRNGRCHQLHAPRWTEPSARDLALDLRTSLSRLSRRQQFLAEALKTLRVSEIAAEKGQHRSTVHRDLAAMRRSLTTAGLDPSL
ncbi:MAG: sigma-70 family RNA polymerase sigma factor [Phycisphaeraceae bacterium]|nr:sigma-70 family RNA polymerase sigma factor [Phycisphaeraceae bacterium]